MYIQIFLSLLLLLIDQCDFVRAAHIENCNLLPSELGPDWYKVPRPIPTGFEDDPDYRKSYIHMPCAATTVFDIAVCSCTNLMSFLFAAVSGRQHHDGHGHTKPPQIKPLDLVKQTEKPPIKPIGTRLLNTKTGEVRHCPFRASSHGTQWYLVHEPTDTWRPMKCAPGTLFEKRACTCVHEDLLSREELKPEDGDIVVLEEEYRDLNADKTISKSLGISISDVDFSNRHSDTRPFWRRQSDGSADKAAVKPATDPKAVIVTLDGDFATNNELDSFNLGKDKIADEHRKLLKKSGKEQVSPVSAGIGTSALILDILDTKKEDKGSDMSKAAEGTFITSDMVAVDHVTSTGKKPFDGKTPNNVLEELSKAIEILGQQQHTAVNNDTGTKDDGKKTAEVEIHKTFAEPLSFNDDVYFGQTECAKKPHPELGPQYFQFFVWGLGYIPYTCYGNQIYDHNMCACVPAPAESTINEINVPVTECSKKALPELGPEYFQGFLWGVGVVAYACYGNRVFDQERCACVTNFKVTNGMLTG